MPRITRSTLLLLCLPIANRLAFASEPSAGPNAGLKIVSTAGPAKAVVQVQPDGKIVAQKGASQPKVVAKMSGNEIVDTSGAVELKLEADGSVTGRSLPKKPKFNASDELLGDDGVRMLWLSPDGTPRIGGRESTTAAPFKVEGVNAKNRRMAVLLVLDFMMPRKILEQAEPAASATPQAAPARNGEGK